MQGEKTLRCAIYCRVAREDKDTPGEAIERQRQIVLAYAQEMSYTETTAYLDNGFSGRTLDRPAMKQLSADMQAGKVDTVIVKDPGRIAREYALCNEWFNHMDKQGVTVLCRDNPGFQRERLELQGELAAVYKRKKRKQARHTVRTPPPQQKPR